MVRDKPHGYHGAMLAVSVPVLLSLGVIGLPQRRSQGDAAPQTVVTPAGEVRVLSNDEAKRLVVRFKKLVLSSKSLAAERKAAKRKKKKKKGKTKPPRRAAGTTGSFLTRLEEVEQLQRVQHKALAPLLKAVLLHDPHDAVRIKAAQALLAQPRAEAVRIATTLLQDPQFRRRGSLAGPLIKLVSFYGAPKPFWDDLRKRFLELGVRGQQEFLVHVGKAADWDSAELLLRHIDPPAPAAVQPRSNPPREYWKRRWQNWRAFRPQLNDACQALFGTEFESRKAAEAWIEKHGGLAALRKKKGK